MKKVFALIILSAAVIIYGGSQIQHSTIGSTLTSLHEGFIVSPDEIYPPM